MSAALVELAPASPAGVVLPAMSRLGRLRRLVRGRLDDPAWVRPALLALLALTALLYLWDLGASGWANSFYSAAVQAGARSWKAFFFGSFDASNFITVDKSPAALWVMELSARAFGLSPWSILVPEALEGVATVCLVYLTVRRWSGPAAGLVAGAVVAATPVAALMFRFDNPDAFMVLLVVGAAYATVRGVEDGRARWSVLAGSLVGFAFLAKMLEALLVVPAFVAVHLLDAPGPLRRRCRQVLLGGASLVVSAGWWLAAVQLTPAADRPYIGGSQDNSIWNLVFGYNGFGRLTGNEAGSVTAGGRSGSPWGVTGLTRLFGADMGSQVSWLLPAALVLLVAGLLVTWRARRPDRARAALVLWGGWLVVMGATFSFGQGIIHPYYAVALVPAIGALVGSGAALSWAVRATTAGRAVLSASVAATALWSYVLLDRAPRWEPWLRPTVLVAGLLAAAGVWGWRHLRGHARLVLAAVAAVGLLAGPGAYTLDTVNTPHSGAIPTAGPTSLASSGGGPGAFGGTVRSVGGLGLPGGAPGSGAGSGLGGAGGGPGGAQPQGGPAPAGGPGGAGGAFSSRARVSGSLGGAPQAGGGTAGGLLDASKPSTALVALLSKDASRYKWVAATVGSNPAAGYQLATRGPVMALGGFNGTDPYPTLAEFERLVRAHEVHYFVTSGGTGFGGGGAPGGTGSSAASAITAWVEANFQAETVGGATVYDLLRHR